MSLLEPWARWLVAALLSAVLMSCADSPRALEASEEPLVAGRVVSDFAAYASDAVLVGPYSALVGSGSGGDIGVKNDSASGLGVIGEVVIDHSSSVSTERTLIADDVWIDFYSTVGAVVANHVTSLPGARFALAGPFFTSTMPAMPALAPVRPGTTPLLVPEGARVELDPSSLGDVWIRRSGALILRGGVYQLRSLKMDEKSRIEVLNPSEILIAQTLTADDKVYVGPAPNAPLTARDIRIEASGPLPGSPGGVVFGRQHEVHAVVLAPQGQVELSGAGTAIGAFAGKVVRVRDHERLVFEDGLTSRLSFGPPRDFPAHAAARALATGDFDGDGRLDVAVVNEGSGDLSVLLGKGNGSFAPARSFPIGAWPSALATADVDSDGRLDLAVADAGADEIRVLLGHGDGTFTLVSSVPVGSRPTSLAFADWDVDGSPDLAVTNAGSDDVSVLLGNGDGTFTAVQTIATGAAPSSAAVGDFDRDGRPDLAVANAASNTVSLLFGRGKARFEVAARPLVVKERPAFIAVGDLDNSGVPDLVVADSLGAHVSLFLGRGDGSFDAVAPLVLGAASPSPFGAAAIADFDGDRKADLAVSRGGARDTLLFLGNGDGTFREPQSLPVAVPPAALTAADFNDDGRTDLAITRSDDVTLLLNTSR